MFFCIIFFIQAVSVNCMSSDKLMISCVLYKSVQGEFIFRSVALVNYFINSHELHHFPKYQTNIKHEI